MHHQLKTIHEALPEGLADAAPRQPAGAGAGAGGEGATQGAASQASAGEVAFSNLNRVRFAVNRHRRLRLRVISEPPSEIRLILTSALCWLQLEQTNDMINGMYNVLTQLKNDCVLYH